ncbi:hypothetical protein [Psychrobacter sp. H8-1]|uniref:hypothetical protein n=1 Tax=Psychrobacter sp. H8-1 TaxID=2774129 RepID=UPI001917C84C|nr:hypothetical protein [Psychrobacter sp. H8-1]
MPSFKTINYMLIVVLLTACNPLYQPEHRGEPVVNESIAMIGISEDVALKWLLVALEQHQVADLDCLQFRTENNFATDSELVWEFAAVEIHNETCGGDPNIAHVRNRYRVNADGSVMVYDIVNAEYQPF